MTGETQRKAVSFNPAIPLKIIHRYILFSVSGTFLVTLLVLTGILCLGNLLKVADLILRGMNPILILKFFGFLIISLLEYAIPMGLLTSAILVFGRLSADNEITGMRACGIGLKEIITPVILLALVMTLVCLYLQNTAIPNYKFASRKMKAEIGLLDPDTLLQPGETISLAGYTINFDHKKDDFLHRIQINQYDQGDLVRIIFARKAEITLDQEKESLNLKLIDGTAEEIINRDKPLVRATSTFGVLNYPISLEELIASSHVADEDKREKDRTSGDLLSRRRDFIAKTVPLARELETTQQRLRCLEEIRQTQEEAARRELVATGSLLSPTFAALNVSRDHPWFPQGIFSRNNTTLKEKINPPQRQFFNSRTGQLAMTTADLTQEQNHRDRLTENAAWLRKEISLYTTEFQKRLSLSAACLSMIFISIPLAIRAQRGEKTIGMALSLALIFFFYIFVAYADAVGGSPEKFPYLIVWLPNLLFTGFGVLWLLVFTRI